MRRARSLARPVGPARLALARPTVFAWIIVTSPWVTSAQLSLPLLRHPQERGRARAAGSRRDRRRAACGSRSGACGRGPVSPTPATRTIGVVGAPSACQEHAIHSRVHGLAGLSCRVSSLAGLEGRARLTGAWALGAARGGGRDRSATDKGRHVGTITACLSACGTQFVSELSCAPLSSV